MNRPAGPAPFASIAAEGTDPALLQRVVARMLRPGGSPHALAKRAARRAVHVDGGLLAGGQPPHAAVERVLAALAPATNATDRDAAGVVARKWRQLEVRAALVGDPAYPGRLSAGWPATGAPVLLAWRGPARLPQRPTVAVVGARRATTYGTGVAAWLAEELADAGVCVVSGGAVGVDAAAHGGALDGPGGTVVVLGCGHGVDYPRVHARPGGLFDRILAAGGALASELLPDTRPSPGHVLARNRLVAGLAQAVVVVEGGQRSGSLRTASAAAELGVAVLAVPGDVRAHGSAAPHRLLAEGASPCTHPRDVLAVLGTMAPSSPEGADPDGRAADRGGASGAPSALPEPVRRELARRWPRAVQPDDMVDVCGLPIARLLAALTRARVHGEVVETSEGVRLARRPGG